MPPTTETEVKELRDLVIGLREEIRVGFAQNDTNLSEFKAEIKGEIQRVETKRSLAQLVSIDIGNQYANSCSMVTINCSIGSQVELFISCRTLFF